MPVLVLEFASRAGSHTEGPVQFIAGRTLQALELRLPVAGLAGELAGHAAGIPDLDVGSRRALGNAVAEDIAHLQHVVVGHAGRAVIEG